MQETRVRRSPFPQQGGGGGGMPGGPTPVAHPSLGPAPVVKPQATPANNFDFDSWGEQPAFPPNQSGGVQPPQPVMQPVQPPMPSPQAYGQPPAGPYGGQPAYGGQPPMHGSQPNQNQAFAGAVAGAFANSMGMDQGMVQGLAGVAFNSAQATAQQNGMGGIMAWFPSAFISLRLLFAVGHNFVLRKLVFLICPFVKKKEDDQRGFGSTPWGDTSPGGGMNNNNESGCKLGPDGLKVDIEDPDGYIPLMSFVTYLVVYSLQRGITSDFKPDIIYSTFSFALLLLLLEIGTAKLAFYFSGSPVSTLVTLMICTYKYVPLCLMVIVRILLGGNKLYYVFFVYFAACAAWSVRRSLAHLEPGEVRQQYGFKPSGLYTHVILGIAAAQIPVCWLLTPSAAAAAAATA